MHSVSKVSLKLTSVITTPDHDKRSSCSNRGTRSGRRTWWSHLDTTRYTTRCWWTRSTYTTSRCTGSTTRSTTIHHNPLQKTTTERTFLVCHGWYLRWRCCRNDARQRRFAFGNKYFYVRCQGKQSQAQAENTARCGGFSTHAEEIYQSFALFILQLIAIV